MAGILMLESNYFGDTPAHLHGRTFDGNLG
jgi:hypothetical protein